MLDKNTFINHYIKYNDNILNYIMFIILKLMIHLLLLTSTIGVDHHMGTKQI